MIIHLERMPEGQRYEDRYGQWLKLFHEIAHTPITEQLMVKFPPWSWVPLLHHLQCDVRTPVCYFSHCDYVRRAWMDNPDAVDRTAIEVLCSFRPETADALWKIDMQWNCPEGRVRTYPKEKEFIVTTNGAYHRQEVHDYMELLEEYKVSKRKVVLVPCAADKPYPAPLHKAILEILPEDFYMANATGVVGIVPQDLWPQMPHYDSGIPNEWRLFNIARRYFIRNYHTRIIVYCDYYALTLKELFWSMRMNDRVEFLIEPIFYPDYLPLMEPRYFDRLKEALRK